MKRLIPKLQVATQAQQDAGREFKDIQKFVKENSHAVEPQSKQDHGGAGAKAGDSGNDR